MECELRNLLGTAGYRPDPLVTHVYHNLHYGENYDDLVDMPDFVFLDEEIPNKMGLRTIIAKHFQGTSLSQQDKLLSDYLSGVAIPDVKREFRLALLKEAHRRLHQRVRDEETGEWYSRPAEFSLHASEEHGTGFFYFDGFLEHDSLPIQTMGIMSAAVIFDIEKYEAVQHEILAHVDNPVQMYDRVLQTATNFLHIWLSPLFKADRWESIMKRLRHQAAASASYVGRGCELF